MSERKREREGKSDVVRVTFAPLIVTHVIPLLHPLLLPCISGYVRQRLNSSYYMIALGKHIENNKGPIRAMMQVRKRKRKRGKGREEERKRKRKRKRGDTSHTRDRQRQAETSRETN